MSRRVITALLVITLLVSPAFAGSGGVRLRYHPQPGVSYEQTVDLDLTIQMQMEGGTPEAAAMMGAMGKDMKQQLTMKALMDVGQAAGDGSLPVDFKFTDVKSMMTIAGQQMEVPGLKEKLASGASVMHGRIPAGGLALEMDIAGLKEVAGIPDELKDRLLQSMPPLPDREIAVGETFEQPIRVSVPAPAGMGAMEVKGRAVYTLRSLSDAEALFDVSQTVSVDATGEAKEMSMAIEGGSKGTASFDRLEGMFMLMRLEMQMTATIDLQMPGMPGADPGAAGDGEEGGTNGASPPQPMKMKLRMSGPVTLTTVRAATRP